MNPTNAAPTNASVELFSIVLLNGWRIEVSVSAAFLALLLALALLVWLVPRFLRWRRTTHFEIDSIELGIGDQKVSFKPNETDRQIAYSIWVELSTRKIGLPIDLEHDVIDEVYDSWHAFFAITRELIKGVPVSKVRLDSTGKIINLSIEVLNEGLRPHLTKWQARFRRWYGQKVSISPDGSPQEIQSQYPSYEELSSDLLAVNKRLIAYRRRMHDLVNNV